MSVTNGEFQARLDEKDGWFALKGGSAVAAVQNAFQKNANYPIKLSTDEISELRDNLFDEFYKEKDGELIRVIQKMVDVADPALFRIDPDFRLELFIKLVESIGVREFKKKHKDFFATAHMKGEDEKKFVSDEKLKVLYAKGIHAIAEVYHAFDTYARLINE